MYASFIKELFGIIKWFSLCFRAQVGSNMSSEIPLNISSISFDPIDNSEGK